MTEPNVSSKAVTIFFCWQSDLPASTHKNAIRNALRKAAKSLKQKIEGTEIVIDEALRASSGAPNISVNIMQKLEKADIVVADITTVTPSGAERDCPNPNVVFELGFGVATVGWSRTILLFNGKPGKGEVPFDFSQNRLSSYAMASKGDKAGNDALMALVEKAIRDIIEQDPKRPAQERGLSRHEIEHQRDVQMVRWLMEHIHVPSLSQTIDELPKIIRHKNLWLYEHFHEVSASNSFHLYDRELLKAVRKLEKHWNKAFSEDEAYTDMTGHTGYIFSNKMSGGFGAVGAARWARIEIAKRKMDKALSDILQRVRNNYLEIEIEETSKVAFKAYEDEMKELGIH